MTAASTNPSSSSSSKELPAESSVLVLPGTGAGRRERRSDVLNGQAQGKTGLGEKRRARLKIATAIAHRLSPLLKADDRL